MNFYVISGAIFSTFTTGLCAYNARVLNDDVTAVELMVNRKRNDAVFYCFLF